MTDSPRPQFPGTYALTPTFIRHFKKRVRVGKYFKSKIPLTAVLQNSIAEHGPTYEFALFEEIVREVHAKQTWRDLNAELAALKRAYAWGVTLWARYEGIAPDNPALAEIRKRNGLEVSNG